MRRAIAMFVFCLLLPQAAFACLPMEASTGMGTRGLITLVSFFLGSIMLMMGGMNAVQLARLPKGSPLHDALRRRRSASFLIGLACLGLFAATLVVDSSALVAAWLFSVFLYKIFLPVLVRRGMQAANVLHSIKIAGEKSSSTRRLAAAGDVQ